MVDNLAPARVTREAAIRFLLEAQHLRSRTTHDRQPTATAAAGLPGYLPRTLEDLLRGRRVFEYWANAACVIPMEDYPLFEGTRRRYRKRYATDLNALRAVARHVLSELEAKGPLAARTFVSDHRVRGASALNDAKTK